MSGLPAALAFAVTASVAVAGPGGGGSFGGMGGSSMGWMGAMNYSAFVDRPGRNTRGFVARGSISNC